MTEMGKTPIIGMLCWESGKYPKGFDQLATLKGNTTNPETFGFPILYERVKGANYETVVLKPDREVLTRMIEVSNGMVKRGVKAIASSCGFNAIFQNELSRTVNVLVITSALLLVPLVSKMIGGRKVGIITANEHALTEEHLRAVGVDESIPVCIIGIQDVDEWRKMLTNPEATIDLRELELEVVEKAKELMKGCPDMGAIVLECTDLPPFAPSIREATGLPVFDVNMLIEMVHKALTGST